MPPKKTTPATKAPAAKTGAKTTPAKTGASKGATGSTAAKGATDKPTEAPKSVPVPVNPIDINLKEIASVITYAGETGTKFKQSGKWLLIIDRSGNSATFFKYRDCNNIVATSTHDLSPETLRLAILGAIRFGKPVVFNLTDTDPEKIMALISERLDEIHKGLLAEIYSSEITKNESFMKMVRKSDPDEYQHQFDYRCADFQFIAITNTDPPSSVMQHFFVVNVV